MRRFEARRFSRDERDLLTYYRALPVEKQLEILEQLEEGYNQTRRLQELAGRRGDARLWAEEQGNA